MSTTPTPTGQGPNPESRQPDYLAGTLTPDPLLKSGSFIEREPSHVNGAPDSSVAGTSNGTEPETSKPRRRAPAADTAWLPQGWLVEDRVRTSGLTAGSIDKYYVDPTSGRRFRSKKEVLYFLETGTVRKRIRTENSDADSLEGSGGTKSKKSGTKAKASALNFDFLNVPEKITWMLTDTSEETWTPFSTGDEKVPDSSKEEWAAAYESLTTRNSRKKLFEGTSIHPTVS